MRTIVHLTASAFYGGPERQMLGLARALPEDHRTVFVTFPEKGKGQSFQDEIRRAGFEGITLSADSPRFRRVIRELTKHLDDLGADVLCCHGYKANLLGRPAARCVGVSAVAVSRGWTGESFKIRLYDALDQVVLHWMDWVVCVSEGQAVKVRRTAVNPERVVVIRNAIRAERFAAPQAIYRERLRQLFPAPPSLIVGAAGRLTPDKGFHHLVEAAARIRQRRQDVGFVLFGAGWQRDALLRDIQAAGLAGSFVLPGFHADLDAFVPHFDLLVLPSYAEGLPNVILEAFAAGVPVVATTAGGTAELVDEGVSGYIVRPGAVGPLAARILQVLASPQRHEMGAYGRARVLRDFTFEAQSRDYLRFFDRVCREGRSRVSRRPACGLAGSVGPC
ncbi:MAG TPA: glycosyltransferase [Gemmataceae bacterium]|nr:glycosyltransferase [Gemmataceae bacterium]